MVRRNRMWLVSRSLATPAKHKQIFLMSVMSPFLQFTNFYDMKIVSDYVYLFIITKTFTPCHTNNIMLEKNLNYVCYENNELRHNPTH